MGINEDLKEWDFYCRKLRMSELTVEATKKKIKELYDTKPGIRERKKLPFGKFAKMSKEEIAEFKRKQKDRIAKQKMENPEKFQEAKRKKNKERRRKRNEEFKMLKKRYLDEDISAESGSSKGGKKSKKELE